jgi:mRNA-degrading endonuclease RelE of RelBE toxin-antitoxin system
MRVRLTRRAARDFESLPPGIQARLKKQLDLLRTDLRHPSVRAKKYHEGRDVWQGRVNRGCRFYFAIEGNTYRIVAITPHPK